MYTYYAQTYNYILWLSYTPYNTIMYTYYDGYPEFPTWATKKTKKNGLFMKYWLFNRGSLFWNKPYIIG